MILSDHDRDLKGVAVDLTVKENDGVPSLAQAKPVRGLTEDAVHSLEELRDEVAAGDRMDEDGAVENDVGR